jgi:hypothetical protein
VERAKAAVGEVEMEIKIEFGERLDAARARLTDAQAQAGVIDAQLRLDGLEKWEQDPEHKRPHPAIGIRVNKVVQMDQDKAFQYALERQKWLRLHLVSFKKDAKLELAKTDPDEELEAFASIVEAPTATISKDLSAYLENDIDVS